MAAMTCASRRVILQRGQALVSELLRINEEAARVETQLDAQGISSAEIVISINKILDAGGPPQIENPCVDLVECTGDTITDRLINILNAEVTGGVDWSALAA